MKLLEYISKQWCTECIIEFYISLYLMKYAEDASESFKRN